MSQIYISFSRSLNAIDKLNVKQPKITQTINLSQSSSTSRSLVERSATPVVSVSKQPVSQSPVERSATATVPSPIVSVSKQPVSQSTVERSITVPSPTVPSPIVSVSKYLSQPTSSVTSIFEPATSAAGFVAGTQTSKFPSDLQSLIPTDYSYHLSAYESLPKGDFLGAPTQFFKAKFYIKLYSEKAACNWITDFEQKTQTTYRILKGCKTTGSLVLFKTIRHCQHYRKYFPLGRLPKKEETSLRQKKTDCPSRLIVRVLSNRPRNLQSLPTRDHLCEVEITYNHNHPINSANALSFRDVSENTKAKFYKYFEYGHSAASVRHQHSLHLQLSGDAVLVENLLADRSTNPNVQDVSRLFQAWQFQQHGSDHGADMFDHLEQEVAAYNKAHSDGGRAAVQ